MIADFAVAITFLLYVVAEVFVVVVAVDMASAEVIGVVIAWKL